MYGTGCSLLLLVALALSTVARAQPERPVYVVEPGDTLYELAMAHGTSVDELRRINGLQGNLLRVGAEIALPAAAAEPVGYRPYLVAAGDTWETVAAATARSVETLLSANPDVPVVGDLTGRLLLIPPGEGDTYRAKRGESVVAVASRFGIEPEELARTNGIAASDSLIAGQPILIPARAGEAVAVSSAESAPAAEIRPRDAHRVAQEALLIQAPSLLVGLEWPDTGFDLPVAGRLSSAFGWRSISIGGNRFHGGIDIAAPPGTLVSVARPGLVTRTGWIGVYGNAVYVDHGDGSQTRYAHLRAIHVQPGQVLMRGDPVGEVGSTGVSTGPHLHFEVRIEGRAVDPMAYLESR